MKTEIFSLQNKSEFFENAHVMHDCNFTATFENKMLILTYENLDRYRYSDEKPWFGDYKKLTVKYYNTDVIYLTLKFGKKEKDYYETVEPLNGLELTMYKYSIDSNNCMILDFYVMLKKKLWGGIIEIYPQEIEYIWE